MEVTIDKIKRVSAEIGCGVSLAKDLLVLAGGDERLVIMASNSTCNGVESLKAIIIDERFRKVKGNGK